MPTGPTPKHTTVIQAKFLDIIRLFLQQFVQLGTCQYLCITN